MIVTMDKHKEKGSAQPHLLMEPKSPNHPSVLHLRAGCKDELQLLSSGTCGRPQRQEVEEDLWEAGGQDLRAGWSGRQPTARLGTQGCFQTAKEARSDECTRSRTSTDVEERDTPIHEIYRSACCREKRSSGRYSLCLIVGLIPNLCALNCLNETGLLVVVCIIQKSNTLQPLHQEGLAHCCHLGNLWKLDVRVRWDRSKFGLVS